MGGLEEKASNSDSEGHNDLVQSLRGPNRSPKNASITVEKIITEIGFCYDLEFQDFHFNPSSLHLTTTGLCHVGLQDARGV